MDSSPEKQPKVKLPECPICIEPYNLLKKRPFYVCRNSHSICRHCYHEHKVINAHFFCPVCKCDMNQSPRQNSDILTLLTFHEIYAQGKTQSEIQKMGLTSSNQFYDDSTLKQKFKIPRIIKIALLLTGLCVFPLIFVLVSEFSHIIMNTEKALTIFVYDCTVSLLATTWRVIWTFMEGFHLTCETLFIYSIIFHIIYVVHMILVSFSLVFMLKLCAEKFMNEQWRGKGRSSRNLQLPKNKVERICFVILINFVQLANRVFQIDVKTVQN